MNGSIKIYFINFSHKIIVFSNNFETYLQKILQIQAHFMTFIYCLQNFMSSVFDATLNMISMHRVKICSIPNASKNIHLEATLSNFFWLWRFYFKNYFFHFTQLSSKIGFLKNMLLSWLWLLCDHVSDTF